MLLRLVVVEGALKGEEVLIRDSITIGRKGVDLNLQDPKVSSKHARIFKDEKDMICIEDMGSSNGTYVNEAKISVSPLRIGDIITIGKTTMKVEDPPVEKGLEKGSWQEVIEDAFNDAIQRGNKTSAQTMTCEAFEEPICLEFLKGPQAGTTLTFGFGPRFIGKVCNDGLLFDTQAPDVAFELHPLKGGLCELRTQSELVVLNDKKNKSAGFRGKLKNGDRLSIGQTVIVVKVFEKL